MRSARGGFTLIEMLIALSIFSMILAGLYGSFLVSIEAIERTENSLLRLHEMRTALNAIRKEVEAARAGPYEEDSFVVRDRDIYGRQASRMAFSTGSTPLAGPARVSYHVREEEEGQRLMLVKKLYRPWTGESGAREAEVLEDIESFTVELTTTLGGKGGEAPWTRTWDRTSLPARVRVTLSAPVGGKTLTLSETIMPMTGRRL